MELDGTLGPHSDTEPEVFHTPRHVEVAPIPLVVQPEEVHELREAAVAGPPLSPQMRSRIEGLVAGHCLTDAHAESEVARLLERLSSRERGAALIVNGVYGSGKTHLLALLGLLCESPDARALFRDSHPALASAVADHAGRSPITVYLSLESFSGRQHDLEQILWDETHAQLTKRGLTWERPNGNAQGASRDELLRSLLAFLDGSGHGGCVWLIDELSMFLGAKSSPQLQNDAAFLQFLAQRASRHPVWLIASVQRSLEHLGDLDTHSLRQLSDRFEPPVTLSLAHVRRIVRDRLVPRTDAEGLVTCVQEQVTRLHERFPRLDWTWERLADSYPFHPATLDCLERVTARFFSRTRSALGFAQQEAQQFLTEYADTAPAHALITPDRLFDHFAPDIEANPELREYVVDVWRHYETSVADIVSTDHEFAQRLVKLLTVLKIGGHHPTVIEATNHLLFDSGLPGHGSYGYTQAVLEALRTKGDYVTVRRHEGAFADQYTIDVGARLGAALRRRLGNTAHLFSAADSRLSRSAFAACETSDWPLNRLIEGQSFTARWQHDRRFLHCRLATADDLNADATANEIALLANAGTQEDVRLLLADPLSGDEASGAFETACRDLPPSRWNAGLVLWAPRQPQPHERAKLVEYAAARLLEQDPSLRDNPRGAKMRELLREELPAIAAECRSLLRELYGAGTFLDAAGNHSQVARDPAELPDWPTALARLLSRQLPTVFPKAPELPVTLVTGVKDASAALAQHRLTHADETVPAGLQAFAAHITEVEEVARPALLRQVPDEDFLADPKPAHLVTYEQLRGVLGKSASGLSPSLLEPMLAGLLASGELQALDGELNPLALHELSVPLTDSVYGFCRGKLVPGEQWRQLTNLVSALLDRDLRRARNFAAQQSLWHILVGWKREKTGQTERSLARLTQIRKSLGHSAADWRETLSTAHDFQTVLSAIDEGLSARQGLLRFADVVARGLPRATAADVRGLARRWQVIATFLNDRGNDVLLAHAYLTDSQLVVPEGPLKRGREAPLAILQTGEALLEQADELLRSWQQWQTEYATAYEAWHSQVHAAERFRPYVELRRGAGIAVVQQLERLGIPLPCPAGDLLAAVGKETGKCCDRPGLGASLRAFPHCTHCGLRLGETIELEPLEKLAESVEDAFRQDLGSVLSDERRAKWRKLAEQGTSSAHRHLRELCKLGPDATTPDAVRAVLTDEVIDLLLSAPAATGSKHRRLRDLSNLLAGRTLTVSQARRAVDRWLDPSGSLGDDEILTFED